jgi:DNA-binding transcriptional regulator LsrR (DeoR family)
MSDYLKSKVSRMYYLSDISKTEIGQHLGISRFRVSRLLEQAREEGIVQIQINEPTDTNTEIEDQLEKRFNLPLAIVVNPSDPTYPGTMRAIGAAAADYLKNLVSDGDVIGITWGATVDEVVNYMPSKMDRRVQVVQITGGLNQSYINLNPTDLVRRVADIFSTKANLLFAPAIVGNPDTRACMMEDSSFKETISLFDRVTIAISGIGALSSSVDPLYLTAGYLQKGDLMNLRESKAVGAVNGADRPSRTCGCWGE